MKEKKESFFYWFFVKDDHAVLKANCTLVGMFAVFAPIFSFCEGVEDIFGFSFQMTLLSIPILFVIFYLMYLLYRE